MTDDRSRHSRLMIMVKNMVRRFGVNSSAGESRWSIGASKNETEEDVEVFQQIGYYSRPKSGSEPECIVLHVGGASSHPVIVATRDEKIRTTLAEDETMIYNSTGASVKIKANGDIEVRCKSGQEVLVDDGSGAVALALKSDVTSIKTAIAGAAVLTGDGGAVFKTNIGLALAGVPVGTTVLKGK